MIHVTHNFSEVVINNTHNEVAKVEISSCDLVSSEKLSSILSKSVRHSFQDGWVRASEEICGILSFLFRVIFPNDLDDTFN